MTEIEGLVRQIDQHMQQLEGEGVVQAHDIVNRMVGYMPSLHKVWSGATDVELAALSAEFSGFSRYAALIRDAYEDDRHVGTATYKAVDALSEGLREFAQELLSMGASLERSYIVMRAVSAHKILKSEAEALDNQRQEWLALVGEFEGAMCDSETPEAIHQSVVDLFAPLSERIAKLAA